MAKLLYEVHRKNIFSHIMLHWWDINGNAAESMMRQLVKIGKNICSKGPEKE
jgi:hypothetical protein